MAGLSSSGPIRVVRMGVAGIAIAAVCYWIGRHTNGLAGFSATIASLGVVAVTLGVVAAQSVEHMTAHRRGATFVVDRRQVETDSPGGPVDRCGLCHRPRARLGGVLLCLSCDKRDMA